MRYRVFHIRPGLQGQRRVEMFLPREERPDCHIGRLPARDPGLLRVDRHAAESYLTRGWAGGRVGEGRPPKRPSTVKG